MKLLKVTIVLSARKTTLKSNTVLLELLLLKRLQLPPRWEHDFEGLEGRNNVKKSRRNPSKNKPKDRPNPSNALSWTPLGASPEPLRASWAPLGPNPKKHRKNSQDLSKIKPKPSKILLWSPLEASWAALGASWTPLGSIFEKNTKKTPVLDLNLEGKMEAKIEKNRC